MKEKLQVIKKHIALEVEEKGENVAIREMRKHLAYYVKNLKDASKIREAINRIETEEELLKALEIYFKA